MSTIIIIAIVIAIAVGAFLVMKSRQNKDTVTDKKSKSVSSKNNTSTPATATPATPAEPKIDLNNLITQLNLLISDKEYAKAEAAINLNLKQDPSLHELYLKLADIYHAQEDDFAIKQLLETLQKLNLNEVYQRVFNQNETFKAEQEKRQALENSKKTPDVFEFPTASTPAAAVDNSLSFDSLANESASTKDNSLEFANLSTDFTAPTAIPAETGDTNTLNFDIPSTPATETTTLDFSIDTASTPAKEETNNLSLDDTPAAPTSPSLDFNLDVPKTEPEQTSPSLDFNLDAPASEPAPTSPSLDFNLETPVQAEPATESFSFDLSAPTTQEPETSTNEPSTPSFDFSLDTPVAETAATPVDFKVDEDVSAPAVPEISSTTQYADLNDPIAQSFTALASTNPVDLDIELAEQYIRLGAKSAAKALLTQTQELSTEQAAKVDALMQKIA